MKHTLFACLLLGVTLGFCIFSSVTVRAETQTVNDAIASSRNAASRDDFESAADSLQAAKETWAAHERFFGVVLAHEELDEVNIAFAELLQYAVDQKDITPLEAQALLAGIVLDTKNFTVRTGSRTFEAAAFLRRAGADTVEVKKLFQADLDATILKYQVIQAARLYRNEIAISAVDTPVPRAIASQASDELLNISGILASFVLYPGAEGEVMISARSIGSCNVQMVLEPLGGGGNAATAGAQIRGSTVRDVLRELVASIDKFYE